MVSPLHSPGGNGVHPISTGCRRWEEIAVALLKKYIDRYYKYRKQEWEQNHLEYHEYREDDPNFVQQYRLLIEQSQDAIIKNLDRLKTSSSRRLREGLGVRQPAGILVRQHLYQPLLHFKSELVEVSPVSLNEGERDFVLDLGSSTTGNQDFFKDGSYTCSATESGRGIGFFEAGNFYPDFILWLIGAARTVRHVRRSQGHPQPGRPQRPEDSALTGRSRRSRPSSATRT